MKTVHVIIKAIGPQYLDMTHLDGEFPQKEIVKYEVDAEVHFKDGTEINGIYKFNSSPGSDFMSIRKTIAKLYNAELWHP